MSYLVLDGFPKGLDVRRFSLAPQPGSLVELSNGHLTNGGEIEKRKAFVLYANVAIAETGAQLTAGVRTFGMQETGVGLTVFGSALVFGASVTLSQPVLASAMPTGVTYQQLKHLAVIDGVTYDKTKHAMTAVTGSSVYGGLIFAVATFADGNVFCYYDGAIVRDLTDGLIMSHLDTNTKIATAIKEMVNRSPDYTATSSGANVTITGPLGAVYQIATSTVSAAGVLTATINNTPTTPASANPATGSFRITGGSAAAGTNKVSKVEVQSVIVRQTTDRARVNATSIATLSVGTSHGITAGMLVDVFGIPGYNVIGATVLGAPNAPTATSFSYTNAGADEATTADATGSVRAGTPITITNGAVDWVTNNSVTASDVAASINAATTSPEYTATATDNLVTIQAASSQGDTPNGFEVKVTTAGNVCVGDGVFQFIGTGMTVDSFHVDGANILSTTFAFPAGWSTINALVAAIAADIRSGSSTHGYTACPSGPLLSISRVATSSKDTPLDVFVKLSAVVAGSGVTHIGGGIASLPALGVTVKPTLVSESFIQASTVITKIGFSFEADINGGVAPYTYTWLLSMPDDAFAEKTGLNSVVSKILTRNTGRHFPIIATVTVTDSLGSVTTSPVVTVYYF